MLIAGMAMLACFYYFLPNQLWSYGLFWYPFVLMTVPLCMLISLVVFWMEKSRITKPIVSFFSLCGKYSFELYLIHVFVYEDLRMVILDYLWRITVNGQWLMSIPVILVGIFLLNRVAALVSRLVFRK